MFCRASVAAGILLAITLSVPAHAEQSPCPAHGTDEHRVAINQYTLRTLRTDYQGCLEVRKDGRIVYRRDADESYTIGNNIEGAPGIPVIKPGTDMTASGEPQVIVGSWSGGAHCCYKFEVLQLGKEFRVVAELDAQDSGGAHFEDIDHDGKYEFVANDWAFAYWRTSFAESPAPKIILRPIAGTNDSDPYHLALDLMRKPAPSQTEFESKIAKIKSDEEWNHHVPPALWGGMLELIYSGHADLAWELFDRAWPSKKPGKYGFLGAFCERLSNSHYVYDLSGWLKGAPADCSVNSFGPS